MYCIAKIASISKINSFPCLFGDLIHEKEKKNNDDFLIVEIRRLILANSPAKQWNLLIFAIFAFHDQPPPANN